MTQPELYVNTSYFEDFKRNRAAVYAAWRLSLIWTKNMSDEEAAKHLRNSGHQKDVAEYGVKIWRAISEDKLYDRKFAPSGTREKLDYYRILADAQKMLSEVWTELATFDESVDYLMNHGGFSHTVSIKATILWYRLLNNPPEEE